MIKFHFGNLKKDGRSEDHLKECFEFLGNTHIPFLVEGDMRKLIPLMSVLIINIVSILKVKAMIYKLSTNLYKSVTYCNSHLAFNQTNLKQFPINFRCGAVTRNLYT